MSTSGEIVIPPVITAVDTQDVTADDDHPSMRLEESHEVHDGEFSIHNGENSPRNERKGWRRSSKKGKNDVVLLLQHAGGKSHQRGNVDVHFHHLRLPHLASHLPPHSHLRREGTNHFKGLK